jgi:hypothetical protein
VLPVELVTVTVDPDRGADVVVGPAAFVDDAHPATRATLATRLPSAANGPGSLPAVCLILKFDDAGSRSVPAGATSAQSIDS